MNNEAENDPQDPIEAAVPRTTGATRVYEGEYIRVIWNAHRCIHVAECLHALPAVFDVQARPWVDVEASDAGSIAAAVRTCPTGALGYEGKNGFPDEPTTDPTIVEVRPGGPLYMRGRVRVVDTKGEVLAEETRVALCRCGRSENKPFCDNSHRLPKKTEG